MRYLSFLLFAFTLTAACSTAPVQPIDEAFSLENDEERLWQRSLEEERVLDNSGLLYRDNELEDYLNHVARKIQPPETLSRIPFKVLVIKNPCLNAFTFPNGVVYIHTGILARMDNEAQLATLLAHEMTHCTHRHALRAFRNRKKRAFSLSTVQESQIAHDGSGDILVPLGSTGYTAAVNGYSRQLETEADMVGLRLISEAGYDPREAPRLFEHLIRELEEQNMREPFFFGTHPKLRNRIENYRNFLSTQYAISNVGIKNTDIFLETTHKVILDNAFLDLKAGRFCAAERGVNKYLTIKPNDPKAFYLLGEICKQRGTRNAGKRAKAYYEKAISIDSSYPDPYRSIGLLYYKHGEKALARRSFESYVALSPQAPDRAYIENYLEECKKAEKKE